MYADTSAVARAYLADEEDHHVLRLLLLEGAEPVVTSELTRLELAGALHQASRVGRLRNVTNVLDRFEADCGPGGPIALLGLDAATVFPVCLRLLAQHPLRTLDALHLAVALEEGLPLAGDDGLTLVARDERQADAARAEGLEVR